MRNKVIVVGSYNVDMTITTDVFPQAGETVIGKQLIYGHGGKGANQAVAAARSGAEVSLLAKVGADQYGEQAIEALSREGINTGIMQKAVDTPTGLASIIVNRQGENSIVVVSGANWKLSAKDIEREAQIFRDADILLTQLETPLESISAAIRCAREENVTVILNPAPAQHLDPELLKDVTIITPNRVEAEMLTGVAITDDKTLLQSADILHSYGIKIVLITLGVKGAFLSFQGKSRFFPSIKVNAIDTVGAGDVFNGVLAAHYSDINSLEEAVSLAVIAAGLSVTQAGAQAGIPDLNTIKAYQRKRSATVTVDG